MKDANLKPYLHLSFDGQIFNLLYDEESDMLAFEIRNNVKYNASYAAFDLKKNKFINKKIQPLESWWTSMLALKNGQLILYQYHDQQNPDLKDIFALDIKKGKQQWMHSQLQLHKVGDDRLYVIKTEGEQVISLQIDLLSGKIYPGDNIASIVGEDKNHITSPFHYHENTDYFATVKEFLRGKYNLEPVQAIDYLEIDQYIIISYYVKNAEGNGLENSLVVLDDEGKLLLHEIISSNLKGIGMDTFVIINKLLIMIKDKSTLKGYKL